MRILFVLPGLHRIHRGAEVAFESIAQEIALRGEHDVTLVGSGMEIRGRAYRFKHVAAVSREHFERWPKVAFLRSEFSYEDLTFAAGLMAGRWREETDLTVTCSYPYTNWALRSHLPGGHRPPHVFVTQNSDWPAYERRREYRFFSCDGLVCTNPVYWKRNRDRWFSTLIPNGIDQTTFCPGPSERARLGLPEQSRIVLMVSALEAGKRVLEGMRAIAKIPDVFCVVAGDGPIREEVDRVAAELLAGRFLRKTFQREFMPALYRSADVFLHTAIGESFGNVYIEALACGASIVAHDDEITRWIFEGHACLIDTTSQSCLVRALERALRAQPDIAAEAVNFAAARYAWPAIAERYSDFFTEVLDRAKPMA